MTTAPEVTARGSSTPQLAFAIPEFCELHRISIAYFYVLQERGEALRVMKLGRRRLISIEEAKRWREERTAAA